MYLFFVNEFEPGRSISYNIACMSSEDQSVQDDQIILCSPEDFFDPLLPKVYDRTARVHRLI